MLTKIRPYFCDYTPRKRPTFFTSCWQSWYQAGGAGIAGFSAENVFNTVSSAAKWAHQGTLTVTPLVVAIVACKTKHKMQCCKSALLESARWFSGSRKFASAGLLPIEHQLNGTIVKISFVNHHEFYLYLWGYHKQIRQVEITLLFFRIAMARRQWKDLLFFESSCPPVYHTRSADEFYLHISEMEDL